MKTMSMIIWWPEEWSDSFHWLSHAFCKCWNREEEDNESLPSASGLTMATIESQGIDFDIDDDDGAATEVGSMPLEAMTIESNDDMSVLTGNTQGTYA